MKVLLLVMKEQRALLENFYIGIASNIEDCEVRPLNDDEQADLKKYFSASVDTEKYDRIVVFIRCKKAFSQRRFFRSIPNLVFLEHDAWQNYAECKYRGEFSRLYRVAPWARIICSGYKHTLQLQSEGFDAVFVPKGYDPELIENLHLSRTVEFAFVGSTKNAIYNQRKKFLEELAQYEPVEIVRTESGSDYVNKLNSIRYFISADIGMGEYMIKNFEAMACGCVLFAYDQGDDENAALGFQDMVNVVLYCDIASLRDKLRQLRANSSLADTIACAGQQLVERNYQFQRLGAQVAAALQPPLSARMLTQPQPNIWAKLKEKFQSLMQ